MVTITSPFPSLSPTPKQQGLLPEDKEFLSPFSPNMVDCISRFLSVIHYSGNKEYEKQMHSERLRTLFGTSYLSVLTQLEKQGIIEWIKIESRYNSATSSKHHNSFRIVEGVNLKKHNIITPKGVKACKRYTAVKSKCKALKKAKKCLESTIYQGDEHEDLKFKLSQGLVEVTRGNYGHRIYSTLTGIKKESRQLIYHRGKTHLKNCEVDIKASHPYLLVMLVNSTEPFKNILPKHFHPVLSKFASIGEQEKEKWMSMYFNEDFYKNFANLFEGSNWKKIIDNFKTKKGKETPTTEREYAKAAFMYVFNGKKVCLLKLMKAHFPESVKALIEAFSIEIKQLYEEIPDRLDKKKGLKKGYRKYKIISIIFNRVESHCMQQAYTSTRIWGHLIHDSILVMEDKIETCKSSILVSYGNYFSEPPIIKMK